MKILEKNKLIEVIFGANLLGTGGGGTIKAALSIIRKIKKPVGLVSVNDLDSNNLVCTVFGVGGKQNCNPIKASQAALSLFQKILSKKVTAIIPVEVGPMAIANAMFIASELSIPLLDSDIVGLRSSPEIFLETITLTGFPRTPCVIADDKGNSKIVKTIKNVEQLEEVLRNFAILAGGDAFVAGYPLKIKQIKNVVPCGSITLSGEIGDLLKKLIAKRIHLSDFLKKAGMRLISVGNIVNVKKDNTRGFCQGRYEIASDKNVFTVIFKNENLVVLKGKKVVLTCPDSINLLNLDICQGVNNFEENKGKRAAILGKKAIPIWRTKRGRKLFSPRNLGLNFEQKLLR